MSTADQSGRSQWNFYLVLALDVVADFYIATSLCFFLYRLRNRVNKQYVVMHKPFTVLIPYQYPVSRQKPDDVHGQHRARYQVCPRLLAVLER